MREKFNFLSAGRFLWSISRFYNSESMPNYNSDISNFLLPRKPAVKRLKHRAPEAIFDDLLSNNHKFDPLYLSTMLYAAASIGYDRRSVYDSAILAIGEQLQETKEFEEPIYRYLYSALAILRNDDYKEFLADTFEEISTSFLEESELNNEIGIVSALASMNFLSIELGKHRPLLEEMDRQLSIDLTTDHTLLIAPLFWVMVCTDVPISEKMRDRAAEMVNAENLTTYDQAIMHQAIKHGETNFSDSFKETCQKGCLRYETQLKNAREKLMGDLDPVMKLRKALLAVEPEMEVETYPELGGYIGSIKAHGKTLLMIDEVGLTKSGQFTKYTEMKLRSLIREEGITAVSESEARRVMETGTAEEIANWYYLV